MNGSLDDGEDHVAADRIALAGEYVLGTLPPDERARVAMEMAHDASLSNEVAEWERALAPLAASVPPVTPPAGLWRRLEYSSRSVAAIGVGGSPSPSGLRRTVLSGSAIWRSASIVSSLLAAGVAIVVLLDRVPLAVPVAALAPLGGPEAAFVVEARKDGVVQVLPLDPAPVPAGHELELWSLARGETTPRPLGILPLAGRRLKIGLLPRESARILVSLEPVGGSPTGLPTGPVLYGGTVAIPD